MSRTKARPSRTRFDLDAIRHANPLPDLAANLTVLKQRGSEWIGCCPFHQDRTPSFTIWRAQGKHWQAHCFGCGWHGDVLDLVCQAYGLSLPDAARRLAASDMPDRPDQRPHLSTEINISISTRRAPFGKKPIPFKERLPRPILANAALRPLADRPAF
jgi:DNA primase